MNYKVNRIQNAYDRAHIVEYDENSKFILMSDCHRGTGGLEDNFAKNQFTYAVALNYYYEEGYTYIELGDGDELWENKDMKDIIGEYRNIFLILKKFYITNRLHFIYGNHDMVKSKKRFIKNNMYTYYDKRKEKKASLFRHLDIYEGIILRKGSKRSEDIFLIHGHQGDFINDYLWKFGRFLVRYIWKPFERLGVKDPTKVVKNNDKGKCICSNMKCWANTYNKLIVAGHTHAPWFSKADEGRYFNTGSCVHPRCITGIEIANGMISLIKWSIKVKDSGELYIGKDILEGPSKISDYFFSE